MEYTLHYLTPCGPFAAREMIQPELSGPIHVADTAAALRH